MAIPPIFLEPISALPPLSNWPVLHVENAIALSLSFAINRTRRYAD